MHTLSRRNFLKSGAVGTLGVTLSPVVQVSQALGRTSKQTERNFTLGLASYTFRKFNLNDTLAMASRLGLSKIAFKSYHLPLEATPDEINAIAARTAEAGLELYGGGVIYMTNKHQVKQAFEYAKAAGMQTIIGVPAHELLDQVNEMVQEYNIRVAIHNHGPGDKLYPSPESIYERVKLLDDRLGICLDIGHCQRLNLDPSIEARRFKDRLLDVHIKDVTEPTENGAPIEIGRGVIDIPEFLNTLLEINYSSIVSFEFEKDENDPLPGLAESVGYVRGVLDVI